MSNKQFWIKLADDLHKAHEMLLAETPSITPGTDYWLHWAGMHSISAAASTCNHMRFAEMDRENARRGERT